MVIHNCRLINLTILMQHFDEFVGNFNAGPYWNAYPVDLLLEVLEFQITQRHFEQN